MKKPLLVAMFSLTSILSLSACGWFQEPTTPEDLSVKIGTEKTSAVKTDTTTVTTTTDTKTDTTPAADVVTPDATTTTDKTVTPDATTTIDSTPADLHPEKARDALRKSNLIGVLTVMYTMQLNEEVLPETNCTDKLGIKALENSSDPSGKGPDASITGGVDCSKSYYYVNKIGSPQADFGVYAKLETPTGNIDCANLGTDKVITAATGETGLYCYAILGK